MFLPHAAIWKNIIYVTTHMALNQSFVGSFLQDQIKIKWSRVDQILYLLHCCAFFAYKFLGCNWKYCFPKIFQLAPPLCQLTFLSPSLSEGVSSKMINLLHEEYRGIGQLHWQHRSTSSVIVKDRFFEANLWCLGFWISYSQLFSE